MDRFTALDRSVPLEKVHFLASTVSSKILNTIAKAEGVNFTETLTGFKHMGNQADILMKRGEVQSNKFILFVNLSYPASFAQVVLFAYEEAIGFMCGTEVLDKDGVSAAVVVAELIRHLETRGLLLTDQLQRLYSTYGYHHSLNSYYLCHDPATTDRIFARIRNYAGGAAAGAGAGAAYPDTFRGGRYRVTGVRDLTTGYDSTQVGVWVQL